MSAFATEEEMQRFELMVRDLLMEAKVISRKHGMGPEDALAGMLLTSMLIGLALHLQPSELTDVSEQAVGAAKTWTHQWERWEKAGVS